MGNYDRRNYFRGVAVDASGPGDPSQYRNMLTDTKLFDTVGKYPLTDDMEYAQFNVWLGGATAVVKDSDDRPGFKQVIVTGDSQDPSFVMQLFEGLKAGWYTLSARVKIQDTDPDYSIGMCFVTNVDFESEDDIKIYLDGLERPLLAGYGLIGYETLNSPDWQVLTAHIKLSRDMVIGSDDLFAVIAGSFSEPGTIATELIQFEPGQEATPWTKSINDFK